MLRYLEGTLAFGLLCKKGSDLQVFGYSDASHGDDSDTRRGRAGYAFLSGGAAVSWKSIMLETVTHSSCESEYLALSVAGNEAIYLSQMQKELGIAGEGGVLLLRDNESSMKLAENPAFHKRSKHVEIKYHSIRERVAKKKIELKFVRSEEQAADMFSKAVSAKVLKVNCVLVGLVHEE